MINVEVLEKAGIDYKEGLERFMNDEELYEMVLNEFVSETSVKRLQKAYDQDDIGQVKKIIHEMKGSSGNAGIDIVYKQACSLMNMFRRDDCTIDKIAADLEHFLDCYRRIVESVRKALV